MTKIAIILIVLAVIFIVIPAIFKIIFWTAVALAVVGFIQVMISETEPGWWTSLKSFWSEATDAQS
jgi:hypothetical protein